MQTQYQADGETPNPNARYRATRKGTKDTWDGGLIAMAEWAGVDHTEIAWAIEEEGRADVIDPNTGMEWRIRQYR